MFFVLGLGGVLGGRGWGFVVGFWVWFGVFVWVWVGGFGLVFRVWFGCVWLFSGLFF